MSVFGHVGSGWSRSGKVIGSYRRSKRCQWTTRHGSLFTNVSTCEINTWRVWLMLFKQILHCDLVCYTINQQSITSRWLLAVTRLFRSALKMSFFDNIKHTGLCKIHRKYWMKCQCQNIQTWEMNSTSSVNRVCGRISLNHALCLGGLHKQSSNGSCVSHYHKQVLYPSVCACVWSVAVIPGGCTGSSQGVPCLCLESTE